MKTGQLVSQFGEDKIYYCYASTHDENASGEVCLILHDLFDHHERYLHLFTYLRNHSSKNYHFYWADFKGHGLSSGARGHIKSFDEFCFDTADLIKQLREKHRTPLNLIGQGLGALVMLKILDPYENYIKDGHSLLKKMVFINPFLQMNVFHHSLKDKMVNLIKPHFGPIKYSSPIKGHLICTDSILAGQYDLDPLVLRKLSLNLLSEIERTSLEVKRLSYFIDRPSLFLAAEDDLYVSSEQIYLYQKGLPKNHTHFKSYPRAKHDLLNDKNRELVFNDIVRWLE